MGRVDQEKVSGLNDKGVHEIQGELREGMTLSKCRKCGCMKDVLEAMQNSLSMLEGDGSLNAFKGNLKAWTEQMEPIKYACLGCEYCYPAAAMNIFHKTFPDANVPETAPCSFEVKEKIWPPVPGEYFVLGEGENFPVAVTTLASAELAEKLSQIKPEGLCIVGKTETENIGIDKVIKNIIANQNLRFLIVAGEDPRRHFSGRTLMSLHKKGVDERMRVIGSPGARPVLRNVTREEIEMFRRQVEMVDMIGCADDGRIVDKISRLARRLTASESYGSVCACTTENSRVSKFNVPVIQAEAVAKENIALDKAGYFVILPQPEKNLIIVEHYGYDNTLLRVIEGNNGRSLYLTLIENGWVTEISHAAYLGKELAKAEHSIALGIKYVQDGA